jgi:hypothetical protein
MGSRLNGLASTMLKGCFGFEHREAFMVLRGDDDPFHARLLGDADDLPGVEFGRVEFLGDGHVFLVGDSHLVFDPLADAVECLVLPLAAEVGVEPPVDEHAVVAIAEKFGALAGFNAILGAAVAPHGVHRFFARVMRRASCAGTDAPATLNRKTHGPVRGFTHLTTISPVFLS